MYGSSEEVLGRWLTREGNERRRNLVVATKVRGKTGPGVNDVGLSRRHIVDSLERSLERLGCTSHIDLLQIHSPDPRTPLLETLRTLNDLVRSGKVHHIGLSNYPAWMVEKAIGLTERMGWERTYSRGRGRVLCVVCVVCVVLCCVRKLICGSTAIVSLQPQYSMLCRSTEWDIIPLALEEGLAVLPWSPLKVGHHHRARRTGTTFLAFSVNKLSLSRGSCQGGWLAGKRDLTREGPSAGSRVEWAQNAGWVEGNFDSFNTPYTWHVLDTVADVAAKTNKTSAQVSLRFVPPYTTLITPPGAHGGWIRWLLQKPGVTSVLVGARTEEQLRDNLGAVGWRLEKHHMDALDNVSEHPPLYPWQPIHDRAPPQLS